MSKSALNLDPQKKQEYIKMLVELAQVTRTEGLLALENRYLNTEGFIHECLTMIIEGYSTDDFTQITNQRINAIVTYIDAQINLIIAGSLAVYGQKSEKIVDLTIKSHSLSNCPIKDAGHVACCTLIKNWTTHINRLEVLNLNSSVKIFCLYAQELFVSEINPGDVILLLNQKKISVLRELRQIFDLILIGLLSVLQGDNPTVTQRKLDCFGHKDYLFDPQEDAQEQDIDKDAVSEIPDIESERPQLVKQNGSVSKNISIEFILQNLCDKSLQNLLTKIEHQHLVEVLVHESISVQKLVFRNMSKDASDLLKGDLETRAKTGGFKNLEEIQLNFIHLVFQCIEEGNIILGMGN